MGVSRDSARRALKNAGVPLVRINERALAVDDADLVAFLASRADYPGVGRPRKRPGVPPKVTESAPGARA